ncbi:MAG TPA: glutamate--tRNA ligase [Dongiaceae bacterium]|nr:glutamate--tRNA ligase [Dongiaceae bacterium]
MSSSPPRVRFAPSPTGHLHIGNSYIALANWLHARHAGGWFLLRFDDTDRERSTDEFAAGIAADLTWLGLLWDAEARQSDRLALYDAAVERLKSAGRLYPCYETSEELALKRTLQLQRGAPPVYDRAALALSAAERAKLEAEGRRPHWRFKLSGGRNAWNDLVRGPQEIDEASQSDPILVRADGNHLYTLTSVADDVDFAISHVIRGADHVTNTGAQIEIYRALGAEPPAFAHLPLLSDAHGEGFSKRLGSLSLGDLRSQGIEPLTVACYLATIGAGAPELRESLAALAADFDLGRFHGGSPRFDPAELVHLNARLLRQLPFAAVAGRLSAGVDDKLWLAARGNLQHLGDVEVWRRVSEGPVAPVIECPEFAAGAALLLPAEPWDEGTWGAWTAEVKRVTGRRGRDLFHPLRLALTAREDGPELKLLLPLIGRARALARLRGETA